MPELAEIRIAARFINHACKNKVFHNITKNPIHKCADVTSPWPLFSIESTTRGKELALILSKYEGEDGAEEVTPPSSVSRPPRRRSCRASSATAENEWQEEESQTAKSEEKNEEKDIGQERGVASGSEGESKLQIVFRFGMSGKFDYKLCEGDLHKHAHLNFHARDNEGILSFVDVRRFGTWAVGEFNMSKRGPDPVFDYQNFRTNVLQNLEKRDFNKPICEALLNQKYFNGIGNYLRAEILDRACVYPFARARDVLECLQEGDQWSMPKVSTAQDLNTVKRSANNNTWGTEEKIQGHTEAEREHVSVGVGAGGAGGEGGEADDNDNDDDDDDIDWSGTGIDFSTRGGWHSENSQPEENGDILRLCAKVPHEVLRLGGLGYMYGDNDNERARTKDQRKFVAWLQCYQKADFNLVDSNKRTIWFNDKPGPLVPKQKQKRKQSLRYKGSPSPVKKYKRKKKEKDGESAKKENKDHDISNSNSSSKSKSERKSKSSNNSSSKSNSTSNSTNKNKSKSNMKGNGDGNSGGSGGGNGDGNSDGNGDGDSDGNSIHASDGRAAKRRRSTRVRRSMNFEDVQIDGDDSNHNSTRTSKLTGRNRGIHHDEGNCKGNDNKGNHNINEEGNDCNNDSGNQNDIQSQAVRGTKFHRYPTRSSRQFMGL